MTDYDELERLAREATPGPWEAEHIEDAVDDWWAVKAPDDAFDNVAFMGREDAAYIAAASPDVILALLEERRVLRDLLGEASTVVHQTGSIRDHADPTDTTGWIVNGIETCADPLCVDARAALQERTEATR